MKKKLKQFHQLVGKYSTFHLLGYTREKKEEKMAAKPIFVCIFRCRQSENVKITPLSVEKNICKPYISEKWVTFCIR